MPGTGHLDRRVTSEPPKSRGRQRLERRRHQRRRRDRKKNRYHFDRHTPEYRLQFDKITEEMQSKCPMAWTDIYDGHWVAADSKHVFELARCPAVSNDHDLNGERSGYQGITIPKAQRADGRARRHPRDGRARAQHLPRRAEPVPVPRRDQAVAALRRRDRAGGPRREDRDRAASTSSTISPTSCPRCSPWR